MQTLDDTQYATYVSWFRIRRTKSNVDLSIVIIYASLTQIFFNYIIDFFFDPDSRGKFIFWLLVSAFLQLFFIVWDSAVWHMYLRVKQDPLLFQRLQDIDKDHILAHTEMLNQTHDFLQNVMSPRKKQYIESMHDDMNESKQNKTYQINDDTAINKHKIYFWIWITYITRMINNVRLVLEGYTLALFLQELVNYMFPDQKTNRVIAWLCVLFLFVLAQYLYRYCIGDYIVPRNKHKLIKNTNNDLELQIEDSRSSTPINQSINSSKVLTSANKKKLNLSQPKNTTYAKVSLDG